VSKPLVKLSDAAPEEPTAGGYLAALRALPAVLVDGLAAHRPVAPSADGFRGMVRPRGIGSAPVPWR
jgi:hypothetical protein